MTSIISLHKKDFQCAVDSLVKLVQTYVDYNAEYVEPTGTEAEIFAKNETNCRLLNKAKEKLSAALQKISDLENLIKDCFQQEKAKDRETAFAVLLAMEEELQVPAAINNASALLEIVELHIDAIEITLERMNFAFHNRLDIKGNEEISNSNDSFIGDVHRTHPAGADEQTVIPNTNSVQNLNRGNSVGSLSPSSVSDQYFVTCRNSSLERNQRPAAHNKPLFTSTPYQTNKVRYNLPDDEPAQFHSNVINNRETYSSIKAPPISLIKFGGNSEDFSEFWAMFENLVDKSSMSAIEKIILLKDCLIDNAAMTIKGIKIVPENYPRMVKKLKQKYENIKDNQHLIVRKLIELPKAENKAEKCAETLDQIQALVNQVVSSGYDIEESTDCMWIEAITSKFPYRVLEGIHTANYDKKKVKVGEFLDQLEKVIRTRISIERTIGSNQNKTQSNTKDQKFINKVQTHYTSEKKPNYGQKKPEFTKKQCTYCGQDHKPKDCPKLATFNERINFVKEHKLCANCLKTNHLASECGFDGCDSCNNQKHHNSLCLKKMNSNSKYKSNYTKVYQKTQANQVESVLEAPPEESKAIPSQQNTINSNSIQPQQQTVLMTAEGQVYKYKTKGYETALFFFDPGAEQSMIEEALAERRGILTNAMEICEMAGFGGNIQTFQTQTVKLAMRTALGKIIYAFLKTKNKIVNPFHAAFVSEQDMDFMLKENIILSNRRIDGELNTPHILIGIDLEDQFIINVPSITLPSGLRAKRTVSGECVCGKTAVSACATFLPAPNKTFSMNTITSNELSEREMVKNLFELDQIGISVDEYTQDEKNSYIL